VSVEGDAAVYRGRVARLSPSIHEQSRTLAVEAEVPNERGRLRPGAFAKADILVAADQAVVFVPASAVTIFAGIEKVLTVREGRAVEVRVQIGRRERERVEIVAGLTPGELVVVEPGNLVTGQPVTVRP
jgi:RND family efflux transporter MFP subunit